MPRRRGRGRGRGGKRTASAAGLDSVETRSQRQRRNEETTPAASGSAPREFLPVGVRGRQGQATARRTLSSPSGQPASVQPQAADHQQQQQQPAIVQPPPGNPCSVSSLINVIDSTSSSSNINTVSSNMDGTVPSTGCSQAASSTIQVNMDRPSNSSNTSVSNTVSNTVPMFTASSSHVAPSTSQVTLSRFMNNSPNPIACVCDPLSINVSQTLRAKIVKGEYIDLALLLDQEQNLNEAVDMKLVVDDQGSFVWKANKPKRQINSIHVWTSAFLVFSSVFLEAHPHRIQELLKYMQIVRSASKYPGMGWKVYDVQFRARQAQHPERSWSILDGELWSMYVGTSGFRPFPFNTQNRGFRSFQGSTTSASNMLGEKFTHSSSRQSWFRDAARQGFCFAFNRETGCKNKSCSYKHRCAKCSGEGHNAVKCKKQ